MGGEVRPAARAVMPRLSLMMFLEFFVWGGWYVTVGNYMDAHGMGKEIAFAYSVCPIAAIVSPFFLGMVADRFFATERVLAVMHLLGGALLLAAPAVSAMASPTVFLGLLLLYALTYMPTLGLTNTLALHHITDAEKQFPMIRVFGTIGWIAANFVISKVLHGDTSPVQFTVTGGAAILLGLISFGLPHTPAPAAGQKASARDILGLDTLALMKQASFAIFVIGALLICIPLAFYFAYGPVFVKEIGFPDAAYTMSLGQASEIVFMLVMPLLLVRIGVKWMLTVGVLAWVIRYALFTLASSSHVLWMVLGGIALHGICFNFFFVTGQIYIDQRAGANLRGQAQGLFVLVTEGFGGLAGAQVAGAVVARYTVRDVIDWHTVWMLPFAATVLVMLVFATLFHDGGREQAAA